MSDETEKKDESADTSEEKPEEKAGIEEKVEAQADEKLAPSDDATRPEDIEARIARLGGKEDELDRIARLEEEKLAARKKALKKGTKKSGLETAASKKLAKIGTRAEPRRTVAVASDADPLIEKTAKLSEWAKENQKTVQIIGGLLALSLLGVAGYMYRDHKRELEASVMLAKAVSDERARIGEPPKDDEEGDGQPVFKSYEDRREAALKEYKQIESQFPKSGAAILARLAEGSLLLDKRDADGAAAAFTDVKASALAAADQEVRGRATEGLGFAYELKAEKDPASAAKNRDDALKTYKELENTVEVRGFKEMAMYHQARVLIAQGEKDKAKELLKSLRERLAKPEENPVVFKNMNIPAGPAYPYLNDVVQDRLHQLDPNEAAPGGANASPGGQGGGGMPKTLTPAQMQQFQEQLKKMQQQQGGGGGKATELRAIAAHVGPLFLVALTGCAGLFGGDRVNPEVPPSYHRPSGVMDVFVHRTLTASSRTVGEDWERGKPEIDAEHNRVFVGSADHGFYALRAGDGSTIWRYETLNVVQSEPLYDGDLDVVYFGGHDGALYAVKASTGERIFRFDTGAEVSKKPVRAGETIFFSNGADFLFAIDRRTGKQKWQVHRTSALGMEIAGHAGPAYDPTLDLVYMAYSDGHVIGYNAKDGSEKWTPVDLSAEAEQAGGEAPRYLDVDTTPILDDHPQGRVVYVSSYAGGIFALDAQTGARVWSNDKAVGVTDLMVFREQGHKPNPKGPDKGGPRVPEKKLLVASSASTGLQGLDPYTGRVLWTNKLPEGGITAPTQVAGAIVVGTTRYGLFLMSPRNGKVIDGIDLGTGFAMTPAAYGGRVYTVSNSGTFVGVSIAPPIAL